MNLDLDHTYDVVVVGSGAGAMAAALTSARAGLATVVVEKTGLLGGTSAYSGAAAWLPGTDVRRRAGSEDSTEAGRSYLQSLLGDFESERREAFLDTAPVMVADLETAPAIEFTVQPFPDYFDAPGRVPGGRSIIPTALSQDELGADLVAKVRPSVERDREGLGHPEGEPLVAGRALIGRLLLGFVRAGGEILLEHDLDELIVDGDRVVGVAVQTAAGPRRIGARVGVVLGAGGFERNQEMRTQHGVPGRADHAMAPAGSNTGAALRAARAVGGAVDMMEEGWWCPVLVTPEGAGAFTLGLRGGLVVDRDGHRYANESLPYDRMGREMAAEEGRVPSWFVFDARSDGSVPAISMPTYPAADHFDAGTWVSAPTLTELAGLIGVGAQVLEETVGRFNAAAAAGHDEQFGRGEDEYDLYFSAGTGPNPALVPVDQAPYYAARLTLGDLGTKGGLRTDVDGRVLREDGTPVPGLHATGNCAASLSGRAYPGPGVPIGTAMVFGWRAAKALAGQA